MTQQWRTLNALAEDLGSVPPIAHTHLQFPSEDLTPSFDPHKFLHAHSDINSCRHTYAHKTIFKAVQVYYLLESAWDTRKPIILQKSVLGRGGGRDQWKILGKQITRCPLAYFPLSSKKAKAFFLNRRLNSSNLWSGSVLELNSLTQQLLEKALKKQSPKINVWTTNGSTG